MRLSKSTDRELVRLYLRGNESCIAILINRHQERLFRYVYSKVKNQQTAEDLFQDTFIKVIHNLKAGKYSEEGKFINWVYRVSHNLIVDYFRVSNRMRTTTGGTNANGKEYNIFDKLDMKERCIEDEIMERYNRNRIRHLLDYLPKNQKEIIMMRHYEDKSFMQIAEEKEICINTALGRMRYAILNLRKIMEEKNIVIEV